jgi:hypothetical protein
VALLLFFCAYAPGTALTEIGTPQAASRSPTPISVS